MHYIYHFIFISHYKHMIIIKCSNCLINLQEAKIVLIVLIAKTLDWLWSWQTLFSFFSHIQFFVKRELKTVEFYWTDKKHNIHKKDWLRKANKKKRFITFHYMGYQGSVANRWVVELMWSFIHAWCFID